MMRLRMNSLGPGLAAGAGALLVAALLVAGCGGGGGASAPTTGQAQFSVLWPQASVPASVKARLIPASAFSIVVTLTNSQNNTVASQTLRRLPSFYPGAANTETATFTGLAVGTDMATILAFASTDGTGVALARASIPITITAGQTATASVTTVSTIQSVLLPPTVGSLSSGQTQQLMPVAFDGPNGSGDVVLTDPTAFVWQSSDPALATVGTTSGLVTAGAGSGPVTITATLSPTEGSSSLNASTTITVANSITGYPGGTPL